MTVAARGPGGMPSRQTSSFTTLSPDYLTAVNLNTTAGISLVDGNTYGVGIVVVAHFDEPITDKTAAEKRLHVTTNPPVAGSWNWVDDQNAHWRPEKYYAPGTSVDVTADIYGARLGDGMYGQEDEHVSFKIGNAHVSIADDNTKQVSVFDNGKLVRTMPTSMGMGGTQDIGGNTLSFWTPPGVYTVLDKANPVVMDSSTFGLPIDIAPRLPRDHPVRHPHQHRRHLPPSAERHRVGAGQHRHVARLPEPQRRERRIGSSTSPCPATSSRSATPAVRDCNSGRTATGACRGTSGVTGSALNA